MRKLSHREANLEFICVIQLPLAELGSDPGRTLGTSFHCSFVPFHSASTFPFSEFFLNLGEVSLLFCLAEGIFQGRAYFTLTEVKVLKLEALICREIVYLLAGVREGQHSVMEGLVSGKVELVRKGTDSIQWNHRGNNCVWCLG